jgi:hypothetical protein
MFVGDPLSGSALDDSPPKPNEAFPSAVAIILIAELHRL